MEMRKAPKEKEKNLKEKRKAPREKQKGKVKKYPT